MANEEFEFSDDISQHANIPKVLINIPNLFSKDNDIKLTKKNGKLTKSTNPALEKQKLLKNKYNADLTLSFKVSDNKNKNNKANKNLPNNNETKFTKLHVTFCDKNKFISPQNKLNNKISLNNSPNTKKIKRNTIEGGDALSKKKLVQSEIITSENNVKLENNKNDKNKKIELKKVNNEKINVIQKRKSLDSKYSDKKRIKYKKLVNIPGKDKNDNNIKKVNTDTKRMINKTRDLDFEKKNKLIGLESKSIKKTRLRISAKQKNTTLINSIKEFNSNSSHKVFNKKNINNSLNKTDKKNSNSSVNKNDKKNNVKKTNLKKKRIRIFKKYN